MRNRFLSLVSPRLSPRRRAHAVLGVDGAHLLVVRALVVGHGLVRNRGHVIRGGVNRPGVVPLALALSLGVGVAGPRAPRRSTRRAPPSKARGLRYEASSIAGLVLPEGALASTPLPPRAPKSRPSSFSQHTSSDILCDGPQRAGSAHSEAPRPAVVPVTAVPASVPSSSTSGSSPSSERAPSAAPRSESSAKVSRETRSTSLSASSSPRPGDEGEPSPSANRGTRANARGARRRASCACRRSNPGRRKRPSRYRTTPVQKNRGRRRRGGRLGLRRSRTETRASPPRAPPRGAPSLARRRRVPRRRRA